MLLEATPFLKRGRSIAVMGQALTGEKFMALESAALETKPLAQGHAVDVSSTPMSRAPLPKIEDLTAVPANPQGTYPAESVIDTRRATSYGRYEPVDRPNPEAEFADPIQKRICAFLENVVGSVSIGEQTADAAGATAAAIVAGRLLTILSRRYAASAPAKQMTPRQAELWNKLEKALQIGGRAAGVAFTGMFASFAEADFNQWLKHLIAGNVKAAAPYFDSMTGNLILISPIVAPNLRLPRSRVQDPNVIDVPYRIEGEQIVPTNKGLTKGPAVKQSPATLAPSGWLPESALSATAAMRNALTPGLSAFGRLLADQRGSQAAWPYGGLPTASLQPSPAAHLLPLTGNNLMEMMPDFKSVKAAKKASKDLAALWPSLLGSPKGLLPKIGAPLNAYLRSLGVPELTFTEYTGAGSELVELVPQSWEARVNLKLLGAPTYPADALNFVYGYLFRRVAQSVEIMRWEVALGFPAHHPLKLFAYDVYAHVRGSEPRDLPRDQRELAKNLYESMTDPKVQTTLQEIEARTAYAEEHARDYREYEEFLKREGGDRLGSISLEVMNQDYLKAQHHAGLAREEYNNLFHEKDARTAAQEFATTLRRAREQKDPLRWWRGNEIPG